MLIQVTKCGSYVCMYMSAGQEKIEIQFPSGPVHFSFQFPLLNYYLLNWWATKVNWVLYTCLDFKLIHTLKSLFFLCVFFSSWSHNLIGNYHLTRLLRLISFAHWTTKLPFSLALAQYLLAPGNAPLVFSCSVTVENTF